MKQWIGNYCVHAGVFALGGPLDLGLFPQLGRNGKQAG